jgi:hypothetical protein
VNTIETLRDLHTQATTERSHYYTAAAVRRAIARIEALENRLMDCRRVFKAWEKECRRDCECANCEAARGMQLMIDLTLKDLPL